MNKRILPCLAVMLAGCQAAPTTSGESFNVAAAVRAWADAYNACDVDALTKLYSQRAQLLPAFSRTLASTPEAIRAAFSSQCSVPDPRRNVTITPSSVQDFGDTVSTAGVAQVSLTRPDGQPAQFPARYTTVYRKEAGRWLIIQHHSSLMPPAPAR